MDCPCGHHDDIEPARFRTWLGASQEARMHARSVLKSSDPMLATRMGTVDGRPALFVGDHPLYGERKPARRRGIVGRVAELFGRIGTDTP
jgi:hypothetical protein